MRVSQLACLFALFAPALAHAGAWTQEAGAIQIIQSNTAYSTKHYFDTQGKERAQPLYQKAEASAYTEYGLYDGITIGGQLAFDAVRQDTAAGSFTGYNLADSEFFARQRLYKDDLQVVSIQPSITLPSPDSKTAFPKIGSDNVSASLRGAYGRNLNILGRWHYADIEAAYVRRMGDAADQWKLDATLGYKLSDRWQVKPQIFYTKSTQKIKAARFTQSSADNYDLVKAQFSVQYAFSKRNAVELGAFSHVSGKNTGGGNGMVLSWIGNF